MVAVLFQTLAENFNDRTISSAKKAIQVTEGLACRFNFMYFLLHHRHSLKFVLVTIQIKKLLSRVK